MRPILVAVLGALGLGAAVMTPAAFQFDFTTIPPAPAELEQTIQEKKYSLSGAVAAAEKAGAVVTSARLDLRTGEVVIEGVAAGKSKRMTYDAASHAMKNEVEVPRFPGAPVSGNWQETASGLKYYELREGTGDTPLPTSKVKVHYSGWTLDGKQFDSSVQRGTPAEFPLNGVIKGWTEGVGSMKVGGKRKLVIPYALAYGEGGRPPAIPQRATLVFDVELLEIVQK